MIHRRNAVRSVLGVLILAALAAPAAGFDSKGHVVVEALAYRTLVEGRDGRPPQVDVLRDLLNDGALAAPICFGPGSPDVCADGLKTNPLLAWPEARTDEPDAAFRRQFSDAGQCFHFMATLDDAQTDPIPGTGIPRALATAAIVRCRDLLDVLLRQIVIDGGPGTRKSAYGLYELMHMIGDSFSGAHSDRDPSTGHIAYLRVWKPLERITHIPTERTARIPDAAYHKWDDHRDKEYVDAERDAGDGRHQCKDLTDHPYEVPFACLGKQGDEARKSLVDLLVVVRDLRREHLAAGPAAADPFPERSEAWRAYKQKWFAPVYDCQGAECDAKQPADPAPGAYASLGLDTFYNGTRGFLNVAARGTLLRYSSDLNPFIYAVSAELGYRRYNSGGGAGLAGLDLSLLLPLGRRASLGFTPAAWQITFGGDKSGSDVSTRFFRFDYRIGDRLFLTVSGPLEINWRKPGVEWVGGVGVTYAPGTSQAARGPLIRHHLDKVERTDPTWTPPEAPYGRLLGRRPSFYVETEMTTVRTPDAAVPGRIYGLGGVGGSVMWDRDRWGERFTFAPALSLDIAARRTTGEFTYLTGVFAAGARWYVLGPLGLSVTAVRIEGGPRIHGGEDFDPSPDVHGSAGSQHYFQPGSRLGIAFNAGIIDLLVEAPTIAWRSDPFNAHEILSFRFSIRLN